MSKKDLVMPVANRNTMTATNWNSGSYSPFNTCYTVAKLNMNPTPDSNQYLGVMFMVSGAGVWLDRSGKTTITSGTGTYYEPDVLHYVFGNQENIRFIKGIVDSGGTITRTGIWLISQWNK